MTDRPPLQSGALITSLKEGLTPGLMRGLISDLFERGALISDIFERKVFISDIFAKSAHNSNII